MKPNDEGGSLKKTIDKKTKNKLNDIYILANGRERKEEGEEKSALKPNYRIVAHMCGTNRKRTAGCFQCRLKR
jgi:hypothetical protein